MRTLTDVDIEIFQFIVSYKKLNNGNSPVLREIVDNTRSASTSTAYHSIKKLGQLGYLKLEQSKARNISVPGGAWVLPLDFKTPRVGEEL